jgi:anti-sigma regulatory factor (Ser/Thr protein kinase)
MELSGPVDLRVPAEPAMSRVLRLAASGVASLCGYSVEEIEDIKIAVSEVLIALIEHGARQPVDVRFDVTGDEFRIQGSTVVRDFDITHPDLQLCRTVLASVCAEHRIELSEHSAHITAVLRRPFNES